MHVNFHQLDDAQHLAARPDRHADHRTSLGKEIAIAAGPDARVTVDIRNDKRLAVLNDPPGQSFAGSQPEIIDLLAIFANGRRVIELPAGFIEH